MSDYMKSAVKRGAALMSCTPYWEDGVYHVHDINRHETKYYCSNNHQWVERNYRKCPGCDFQQAPSNVEVL